ncbi:MAG: hypothetical protein V3V05_05940 [Pontiella sp.]
MHTATTLKTGMHHFHDDSVNAMHYIGHLLHEKSFWAIVAITALIVGLSSLIILFGSGNNDTELQHPIWTVLLNA